VTKSAHATTDKAGHALTIAIYQYRRNIIYDEFETSENTNKDQMPNVNLEGTENGHEMLALRPV
jgi:hypothetical protein